MKNPLVWLVIAIVAVAGYYFWRSSGAPEPPAPVASTPPPPPPAPVEPPHVVLHPIPEPPADAAALPPLPDSDTLVNDALTGLFGRDAFVRFFHGDGLVRRFVATVDNLPRKTAAVRLMPVRPVPGAFEVSGSAGAIEIGAKNALRYRPYVQAMEAVEAKRLVATYVRFYPLFQTAYQELGYPNGYFNDRLVQAIDDLLAAPDVAAPRLVQPKVLYQFADPDLENRSAGQKIMMRMGSGNAARVKDKLRALRHEIAGQMPAR